jgi:putative membrane protein
MKRAVFSSAVCLLSVAAWAAAGDAAKSSSRAQLFVTQAGLDGMTEVQMAELAQTRSSNPQVRKLAALMVSDHGKTNAELKALAAKKGLEAPNQLDPEHATMLHSLSAKPASEFDGAYAKHMVEAHVKAIQLFEDETYVSDAELAAFAKKTLPTLTHHKQLAEELSAQTSRAPAADTSVAPQ